VGSGSELKEQRPAAAPLRIALVAPPWYGIPPVGYGGIERICFLLAQGLVECGHDVTVIGTGEVHTSARFIRIFDEPLVGLGTVDQPVQDARYGARLRRALDRLDVDLVHDHSLIGPVAGNHGRRPTIVTAHGPAAGLLGDYYRDLELPLVAISDNQRRAALDLPWLATIPNAVAVRDFPFQDTKEDFAVFVGRMSPEKGVHVAIDAARGAGVPLILVGKCQEPYELEYFECEIRPRLGTDVEWRGELSSDPRNAVVARATCLLTPSQWDEPFGLAAIEALACGTPVVTLDRGAIPELLRHGRTGLVCREEYELSEAIVRARRLDPVACRTEALQRFNVDTMVSAYEKVYHQVVAASFRRTRA
jgi:glycosyltransferase involved in cell wall biosynthesis